METSCYGELVFDPIDKSLYIIKINLNQYLKGQKMQCSFCLCDDENRIYIQGAEETTHICSECIKTAYEFVVARGIETSEDLDRFNQSIGGSKMDYSDFSSDYLSVRYVEFFKLGNRPDSEKGDFDDDFAVWNYFIPSASLKIFNDQIYLLGDNYYFSKEEVIDILENAIKGTVNYAGNSIPGQVLEGLIRTAISRDNDVEEVYSYFSEDVEILEGVDDIPSDYSNTFGCRVWSFDVEGGRIEGTKDQLSIDFSQTEYEDDGEYAQMREDEIQKSIAIVCSNFD